MPREKIAFITWIFMVALVGCRRPTPPMPASANEPVIAEIPSSMDDATQVVHVTADDSMHFNGNRFTVKTGQLVRIELTNKGHRPREDMAHNFVILKPGIDATSFNLLSAQSKATNFIPSQQADSIFSFTPGLVGPGETAVAAFTAPAPGEYTFLCNFPGHYAAGMHGTMTVVP